MKSRSTLAYDSCIGTPIIMKAFAVVPIIMLVLLALIIESRAVLAQNNCANDFSLEQLHTSDPSLINQALTNLQTIKAYSTQNSAKLSSNQNVKRIPVVVHVIHNSGTNVGTDENISDAQIIDAIAQLNEDFRKIPATTGFGSGVDTEIEFVLAKVDETGGCMAAIDGDGIVRIASTETDHVNDGWDDINQVWNPSTLALFDLSTKPNNRYFNIYVVNSIIVDPDPNPWSGYSYVPYIGPNIDLNDASNWFNFVDGVVITYPVRRSLLN